MWEAFMPIDKVEEKAEERDSKTRKFPRTASREKYIQPQPILESSCIQEQMDRSEGMGVDDEKTYHRTEK
jgi:hypothetical protein